MKWSRKFVKLDSSLHDRTSFDSGKPELNHFLQHEAARHERLRISKTVILPAEGSFDLAPICAFYTTAPTSISREDLPPALKKQLPRYPVPVLLIGQLAVHLDCASLGLGGVVLVHALKSLQAISNEKIAAYVVVVDCLDNDAKGFYMHHGFGELCKYNDRDRLYWPINTIAIT